MTAIVVTEEQAKLIKATPKGIVIQGRMGECLGVFKPDSTLEEDIQIALERRASGGPYVTTAEVLAHLKSLEDRAVHDAVHSHVAY